MGITVDCLYVSNLYSRKTFGHRSAKEMDEYEKVRPRREGGGKYEDYEKVDLEQEKIDKQEILCLKEELGKLQKEILNLKEEMLWKKEFDELKKEVLRLRQETLSNGQIAISTQVVNIIDKTT
jgi:Ser-tRNA(Ala) deacylase AlaX